MPKNNKISAYAFSIVIGTLLSLFLILTASYCINLIYLIGDYPEIFWLFGGIIAGTILFSVIGAFVPVPKKINILYSAVLSVLFVFIAYIILAFYSFGNPDIALLAASILVSSIFMVTAEISNYLASCSRLKIKVLQSGIIAVLSIVIIFLFAIFYELSGQTILPEGLSVFAYITLIAIMALMVAVFKKANPA